MINGSKGRARFLAARRDVMVGLAKAAGIDTTDTPAVAAWVRAYTRAVMLGIYDRSACGCGGTTHEAITGSDRP